MNSSVANVVVLNLLDKTSKSSLKALNQADLLQMEISEFDFDSLDKLEMVMSIEDALGIVLPEAGLEECRTVAELVDYCELRSGTSQACLG